MMRHMSYVISVKDHELPYGDWLTMVFEAFGVPLVETIGEEMRKLRLQRKIQKRKKKEIRMTLTGKLSLMRQQLRGNQAQMINFMMLKWRAAEFLKFQAEFERKRANRFLDDLEKAKAENARLLALLHQAQTKPHP
ncbi:hypothetical protein Dimus_013794 [Dionaea muscipula]